MSNKRGPKPRTALTRPRRAAVERAAVSSWEPPDYLPEPAQSEYQRLVGVLRSAGVLDKTDPRLIELYAINYDVVRRAYAAIAVHGLTFESDRGNLSKRPEVETLNAATIRLKDLIRTMGLCPLTAGVTNPPAAVADPGGKWDGLLSLVP